jgi:hypothetical protein
VEGELGVPDLEGLSSKTVSQSIKLEVELVDSVDIFECRLGRGGGVVGPAFRGPKMLEGIVGRCVGGPESRRELVRLEDDIFRNCI